MMLSRRSLLAASAALAMPALRRAEAQAAARVALLHINDFHSRHEAIAGNGGVCDPTRGPCFGGSARLVGALRAARAAAEAEGRAAIAVDAGDQFMGSLYYTTHRGLAEAAIQRAWGCEAMALGNHEFDHGPQNLARYAAAVPFPLLSANLDTSAEPALAGRITPSLVLERGGARLALIGLTTTDTPVIASPGPNLRFRDPAESLERAIFEARRNGPATVILLSHLGFGTDRRLAAEVPGVDVIVGGHSHTLLADLPGAAGPHPVLADGRDRQVRIVQAGALGRYAGRLDLDLGADGRLTRHGGAMRELGADTPEDPEAARIVAEYGRPIGELRRRPIAQSAAELDNNCRDRECALGNLIAEAMLAAVPGAEIALQNGGGIRAGLPGGTVTYGDILTILPFGNTVAKLRLRGADLRAALENGLSQPGAGRFPQVAGLRFVWDAAAPAGSRLGPVEVQRGGRWEALEAERVYLMVTNNFLRNGGDAYAVLRDNAIEPYDTGPLLEEVVADFIAARSPMRGETDGRISRR
jgi:5'-nucleotidase / UDP-sugar diphosphatase